MIKYQIHHGDIPKIENIVSIALDTETTGLIPNRDRICLIQMCIKTDNDTINIILKIVPHIVPSNFLHYICSAIPKILHFARFDLSMIIAQWLLNQKNTYHMISKIQSVFCTKIASKIIRTYTDYHGLKELCRELLGVHLDKSSQRTDWANELLTEEQLSYAISDVIYLHDIHDKLVARINRENRIHLSLLAMNSIVTFATFDAQGFNPVNIFEHK